MEPETPALPPRLAVNMDEVADPGTVTVLLREWVPQTYTDSKGVERTRRILDTREVELSTFVPMYLFNDLLDKQADLQEMQQGKKSKESLLFMQQQVWKVWQLNEDIAFETLQNGLDLPETMKAFTAFFGAQSRIDAKALPAGITNSAVAVNRATRRRATHGSTQA